MSKLAEAARVQVRGAREAALKTVRGTKKTPLDKTSPEGKRVRISDLVQSTLALVLTGSYLTRSFYVSQPWRSYKR